jgi:Ca2+-binding RTX toxin-like protein
MGVIAPASIVSDPNAVIIETGLDCLVRKDISIVSNLGMGIVGGATHNVFVYGDVFGSTMGISLGQGSTAGGGRVYIGAGGTVGSSATAVALYGGAGSVLNYGSIDAFSAGITGNFSNATSIFRVNNYGSITAVGSGVRLEAGGALFLNNFGNISIELEGTAAVLSRSTGGDRIYNRGSIGGSIQLGDGANIITNRGLIMGDIAFGLSNDIVDNRGGIIEGTVTFGIGNDTFRPGLTSEVAIGGDNIDTLDFSFGGAVQIALDQSILATAAARDDDYTGFENVIGSKAGSDVLVGDANENVLTGLAGDDKLYGQAGNDKLDGGLGNDTLDGGAGSDKLNGDAGNNTLIGGDNNDQLRGGDGIDSLDGGDGQDILYGFAGNDSLLGGAGNDTLVSGDGDDLITGGAGFDEMSGGAGSDRFIFLARDFAVVAKGIPDVITDFRQTDRDKIDLSAVDASSKIAGDQAFSFIGTNEFSKVAGQLRFTKETLTTVYGDVNGDGVADFNFQLDLSFVLEGGLNLTAADFVL